jgi:outer membrane protein assembly factor BamB
MYKPTIMLCAFGLLADDGRYYALRAKEGVDLWQHENGKIQVTGTFTKGTVQHPVFQGEGTIETESVKVLK